MLDQFLRSKLENEANKLGIPLILLETITMINYSNDGDGRIISRSLGIYNYINNIEL